jgi:hypothetical protein
MRSPQQQALYDAAVKRRAGGLTTQGVMENQKRLRMAAMKRRGTLTKPVSSKPASLMRLQESKAKRKAKISNNYSAQLKKTILNKLATL